MSSAILRIQVATLSDVTDGESRVDGAPSRLVTVTSIGSGSVHALRFWDTSGVASLPVITKVDERIFTFTPSAAFGQSFGLELVVDADTATEARVRRKYAIPTERQRIVLPIFAESADPDFSLQNMGTAVIARSTDNAGADGRGWHKRILPALQQIERLGGSVAIVPSPRTIAADAFLPVGSFELPKGSIFALAAHLGCVAPGDTATLEIRQVSDDAVIGTVGGVAPGLLDILETVTTLPIALADRVWCYAVLKSDNPAGTAVCAGISIQVR